MPEDSDERSGYVDAIAIGALSEAEGRVVCVAGQWLAMFRQGGNAFAIDNACPHMAGPLGSGSCEDGVVTCPIHGWRFDIRSGVSTTNPNVRVARFDTRIRDGRVWVRIAASDAEGDRT